MRLHLLALTAILVGPTLAHAQPAIAVEDLGGELDLASNGKTLVVAVDTQQQPRLRFYDFATHKQTGTARGLGADTRLDLVDGATFFANGAVYASATGKLVIAAPEKPFRSMVRAVTGRAGVYAVAGTNDAAVIAFDGKQLHRIELGAIDPEAGMTNAVAFSPDGKRLAVGTTAHFVWEVDTATWKVARNVLRADGRITALAYVGGVLAIGVDTGGEDLILVDTATGKPIDGPTKKPVNGVLALAVSPDGAYLAVGGGEYRIRIYATATWKQKAFLEGATNPVSRLVWSGDGKYLASSTAAGELRVWAPFGE